MNPKLFEFAVEEKVRVRGGGWAALKAHLPVNLWVRGRAENLGERWFELILVGLMTVSSVLFRDHRSSLALISLLRVIIRAVISYWNPVEGFFFPVYLISYGREIKGPSSFLGIGLML